MGAITKIGIRGGYQNLTLARGGSGGQEYIAERVSCSLECLCNKVRTNNITVLRVCARGPTSVRVWLPDEGINFCSYVIS